MAPLLRSRLSCFYCGRRSAQSRAPGLRKFECEHCDAENYFDENGEITDPPAPAVRQNHTSSRFALPSNLSTFDETDTLSNTGSSIFCSTCLKNQHLLTSALAQYQPPDESSPDTVAEYERAYPAFYASLEERYPQICADCEPQARQHLREVNYAAKADNLRRVMDRTGLELRQWNQSSGWLGAVVWTAGLAWGLGWLGSMLWHAMGALAYSTKRQSMTPFATSGLQGTQFGEWEAVPDLEVVTRSWGGYAILLSLASIWWNPKMHEKLKRKSGRMIGLQDYYTLQTLLLAVRSGIRYAITRNEQDHSSRQAVHLLVLLFSIPMVYRSLRGVQIDYTPKVTFRESPKSLLSQEPRQTKLDKASPTAQRFPTATFPLESLAPKSLKLYTPTGGSPSATSPADMHNAIDSMDWTPTAPAHPLAPPRNYQPQPPAFQSSPPSPFYGHLPADVVSPAHRLRNPPNKPVFRTASAIKKAHMFVKSAPKPTNLRSGHDNDDDDCDDDIFSSGLSPSKTILHHNQNLSPAKAAFRPPAYRASHSGEDFETGLESIMERAFTIGEEPAEVRDRLQSKRSDKQKARTGGQHERDHGEGISYVPNTAAKAAGIILVGGICSILYLSSSPEGFMAAAVVKGNEYIRDFLAL